MITLAVSTTPLIFNVFHYFEDGEDFAETVTFHAGDVILDIESGAIVMLMQRRADRAVPILLKPQRSTPEIDVFMRQTARACARSGRFLVEVLRGPAMEQYLTALAQSAAGYYDCRTEPVLCILSTLKANSAEAACATAVLGS